MVDSNANRKTLSVVIREEVCEAEGWSDPISGGVQWWTLLSADRTPSQSMACGIVEIGPGTGGLMIAHKHAQAEIYHILAGQGVVTIDRKEYQIKEGSTVFIPGDAEHSTRNTGEKPLRLFYVFAVDSVAEVKYEFER